MIVISESLGDQSDQFRRLATAYGLHVPNFYLEEGMISESELDALRKRFQLTVLPVMSEAELQAAELLHYRSRSLSVCEARVLVLAKKHKLEYLLHDAALRQVCRTEGVAIVDNHIED